MDVLDKRLAYFLMRFALGVNMLVHGLGRMGDNQEKFISGMVAQFAASPLPAWSVEAFGHCIPFFEAGIGFLLVLGLCTRWVSLFGGLLMVSLIFGMGLLQKWEIVGLQMLYVLFYCILLFGREWDFYSVDGWRSRQ